MCAVPSIQSPLLFVTLLQFLTFIGLAVAAAYLQALTGFAFALVLVGGVTLFDLFPLEQAAVVVGLLTLINAVQMLLKGDGVVIWRLFGVILAGTLLLLPVGYFLLQHLSTNHTAGLSIALGTAIMICSLPLSKPVEIMARIAPLTTTFVFGALSGLMTGLFSAGGPPLVYHLYRQPLARAAVAETLVGIFGATQLVRLTLVGTSGGFQPELFVIAGLTLPAVVITTHVTKRLPPPLGPNTMRKLVAGLLFLSGLALMVPPLIAAARATSY
jgi:uncharacterized membrane protein YfcA